MKQLKSLFAGLIVGGVTLFILTLGLALVLLTTIVLVLIRLFTKVDPSTSLKEKLKNHQNRTWSKKTPRKGEAIEGHYYILDSN